MKKSIFISLVFMGLGWWNQALAQQDDIYFNNADVERLKRQSQADNRRIQEANYDRSYDQNNQYNSSNQEYQNYGQSYEHDGSYLTDNVNYAAQIRRFNYPFYNVGYYSPYYNPYSYDPFWVDPFWGWSPWASPGISISFGFGRPYWSSAWGWNSWWGYPNFYSAWSYPCYGSWFGNYYSGYWNGYYAGLNGGGWAVAPRSIVYGPRNASNAASTVGVRQLATAGRSGGYGSQATSGGRGIISNQTNSIINGPRNGQRVSTPGERASNVENGRLPSGIQPDRHPSERPSRGIFNASPRNDFPTIREDGVRSGNSIDRNSINPSEAPVRNNNGFEPRQSRPDFQDRDLRQPGNTPRFEAPREQRFERRFEQPRSAPIQQQPQRSFEAPRFQASPRFEMPRQSAPVERSGGSSFGGSRRR